MRTEDRFYMLLGAKIRSRREELGLTQHQLSSLVGFSRPSLVNVEKGRQRVMAHQLLIFASALQVDIRLLLPSATDATTSLDNMLAGQTPEAAHWIRGVVTKKVVAE